MRGRRKFQGWSEIKDVDRRGRKHAKARDWEGLWRLILDAPVADAVRLARRLRGWSPPRPAERELLDRLLAVDEQLAARVADLAAAEVRTVHHRILADPGQVSFGFGTGAMAHMSSEPPGITRVSTLLPDGRWGDIYVGELEHGAIGCVDTENIIASREDPQYGDVLVHYTPGRVRAISAGPGAHAGRIAATRAGFVAGLPTVAAVVAAGPDLPAGAFAMGKVGVIGTHRFAVDPTGSRVAFGGGKGVVVTDAEMEYVVARTSEPMPHGNAYEPAFTGWGDVIVTGTKGGLSRWSVTEDGRLVLQATAESPYMGALFSIPAWNVIGGRVHGQGRHYFYDPRTLARVGEPAAFVQGRYEPTFVHAIAASADGRMVAVGGQLLVYSDDSVDFVMVTYNLDHPLAPALLPLSTLARSGPAPRTLTLVEMMGYGLEALKVINLVEVIVQHHPDRLAA